MTTTALALGVAFLVAVIVCAAVVLLSWDDV